MSEHTEFLHAIKDRRCGLCGGPTRLLVDIDSSFPQLDQQGRTQYVCLQCDGISYGEPIIRRMIKFPVRQGISPRYRLYVLGQFALEHRSGQRWQPVAGTAEQLAEGLALALLHVLISSPGRGLSREQAIEMLWSELDFETATNRLDKAVYNLRRLFEPGRSRPATSNILLTEHATLILADQSQLWVDADAFEALLSQARESLDPGQTEQLLEEAMLLYGGDYLPKEHVIPWVGARRESLYREWVGLMLELADLRITHKALSSAIDILDRLLAVEPTNEAAVQRLVVLLAQSGWRAEAVRVFQRFAAVLRQEYNIAPLPETRALFKAL
jgi:DNA-binding SARP family transcriptional activator